MKLELVKRREFLKRSGLITGSLLALKFPVWANSIFAYGYPLHNIPANKNIDPAWIKKLYVREGPTKYFKSRNELKYIGMPVGGLHAGTVYLGGDGRLWLWQIYNETFEAAQEGIVPKTITWNDGTKERKIRSRDGAAYVEPNIAGNHRVLDQGFAIRVQHNGISMIKELNEESWDEICFEASYPTATIKYSDKNCPVEVYLKVYSPFIPLDAENSALPATILRLEVKNITNTPAQVSVVGCLENGSNKLSAKSNSGKRKNEYVQLGNSTVILSSFETSSDEIKAATDYGTICLALRHPGAKVQTSFSPWPVTNSCFDVDNKEPSLIDAPDKLVGGIGLTEQIMPGRSLNADYAISWHFNNPNPGLKKLVKDAKDGFYYGQKFKNAVEVSSYLDSNFTNLTSATELWQRTWNDSSLPHWFLDRTFINIGTLATANTYRFADGRFWGWEGVGACPGTCTHVWQYAQSVARIFPELERILRERVDLGVGFKEDTGAILFRGENENRPAIDGQAGTILRFYREHQMSKDNTFLQTCWPRIKKAVQFMLAQDKNGDGMTDTPMENTLDAVWEGEIAWIVGLCIAAASAAHAMAEEMNDLPFAKTCADYVTRGQMNMEKYLFNGEYFIHRPDKITGKQKLGSYNTCHIDQVYGQSWAFQVGLPRILDKGKVTSALTALWKYNFTTDVGPYIKTHTGGRPYALAGEGGMIMNTNPHNEQNPYGENVSWQLGYFHECMSGFEHQVAAHMMAEGMVDESLVLTKHIHDRHHATKRNPFNEIECSDHYARAMASYGSFISACGFEYHGPKGYIAFAPKWNQENFKAAFTAAEGWGTYSQKLQGKKQVHILDLKYGSLKLNTTSLQILNNHAINSVAVTIGQQHIPATIKQTGASVLITYHQECLIKTNQSLTITVT